MIPMSSVVIFDLDDTLYDEYSFVQSGFKAVGKALESQFGWPFETTQNRLEDILQEHGRGAVFDIFMREQELVAKAHVVRCLRTYRIHKPEIKLYPSALDVLKRLNGDAFLVTDGNKLVQKNKVDALDLWSMLRGVYITHRFGIRYAKPSTYCFEKIRTLMQCDWEDLCYVADNPQKDFVNLNRLGVKTIRVLTGGYSGVVATPEYDARISIGCLSQLSNFIDL